ncbi:MAG: Asp-tRNA(Asn)/Glu-tRNA(Gln) amidotransferase subunit GatC [Campylobacter sp.]|mgnify:FL=1|jgi:aspartyl/glutamyl-tRNA(asn/gln) amidotransferase, C subunit|uniref:Asp-tRNA(Asn)/Glu-tRNA(Gln) amidotransferase subunit GatC n=1 Tax=Campylobacter sp. TaxID=205 RepID=UPI000F1FA20B|nr:Asp-tRNA(Asn)/Glu-tRNA(Gln) amidotransferase subunit GatC [uncultured Campylobacter sp.]RKV97945.1 MAG: Asp-tRNA(Asn)/Glu-tRNA(Gln) amidotransferase subunit GatC [Campylobacter sp.]
MQIDDTLLAKLEKLSSLKIGEEKRKEIENQLSEILNFVDILDELDLSDVGAVVSSIDGGTPLREDVSVSSDVIETILKHAPMSSEHFFVVPKIIE